MCLFYKRLDRGNSRLPEACALDARHVELDESLLDALLDGVDLGEAPKSAPRRRRVHWSLFLERKYRQVGIASGRAMLA